MFWNWLRARIDAGRLELRSEIGPGGLTRQEAHAAIQRQLEGGAALDARVRALVPIWRRGAEDDTVIDGGERVWAIYAHAEGGHVAAGRAWAEDFVDIVSAPLPVRLKVTGLPAPDPVEGRFGELVMTCVIGVGRDGGDSANLVVATHDERAVATMALFARSLGLDPAPGTVHTTPPPGGPRVSLDGDRWLTLHCPNGATYPVLAADAGWCPLAAEQARVVLALAHRPMPRASDLDVWAWIQESAAQRLMSITIITAATA